MKTEKPTTSMEFAPTATARRSNRALRAPGTLYNQWLLSGSSEQFNQFLKVAAPLLYGISHRFAQDPHLCEEAVQETIIKLFQRRQQTQDPIKQFSGWVYTIILHEIRMILRKKKRQMNNEESYLRASAAPLTPAWSSRLWNQESQEEKREVFDKLIDALKELPRQLWEPIVLHIFDGIPHSQVSKITEVPESTTRQRIQNALSHLRARLRGQFEPNMPCQRN